MGIPKAPKIGQRYETKSHGIVEVMSVESPMTATVRFIATGYTTTVTINCIQRGEVKDWTGCLRERIGEVLPSLNCGDFIILEYLSSYKVKVKFNNTGTVGWYEAGNILTGKVMDYNAPSVEGVGFLGYGEYSPKKNRKAYVHWFSMLRRCNTDDYLRKNYFDCTVHTDWHSFQNFAGWAEDQVGFTNKSWHLDKDILIPGNREYSAKACCFIPCAINSVFGAVENVKGYADAKDGTVFFSVVGADGVKVKKGFKDRAEGKLWYTAIKEATVKALADKYKTEIDSRVYEALYSWKVK